MDFNAILMIKLLLIIRYKFGYMVPNRFYKPCELIDKMAQAFKLNTTLGFPKNI